MEGASDSDSRCQHGGIWANNRCYCGRGWTGKHCARSIASVYGEQYAPAIFVMVMRKQARALCAQLQALDSNFNNQYQWPVMIIHEADFTEPYKAHLRQNTMSELRFVLVDLTPPVWALPFRSGPSRHISPGYRGVMRFYAGGWVHHPGLAGVTHYLRVDADQELLSPMLEDPAELLLRSNGKHIYGCLTRYDLGDLPGYHHKLLPMALAAGFNIPNKSHFFQYWERTCTPDTKPFADAATRARTLPLSQFQCLRVCNCMVELGATSFFNGTDYQRFFRWVDSQMRGFYQDVFNDPEGDFKLGDHVVKAMGMAMFAGEDPWLNFDDSVMHFANLEENPSP